MHRQGRPGRLSVRPEVVDDVLVVTVRGEIDHDAKRVFGEALTAEGGSSPPRIVVDLSGVSFMDSSGINVLVSAYRRVSAVQGWLRIAGASESVARVLHLAGLDEIIPCRPTLDQALHG